MPHRRADGAPAAALEQPGRPAPGPLWAAQLLSASKSFVGNPLIGSRHLDAWGCVPATSGLLTVAAVAGVEIWADGRRSPFLPSGTALARRSLVSWRLGDLAGTAAALATAAGPLRVRPDCRGEMAEDRPF